ncbi:MAG: Gfo/Idh/MocA family oxidoreductase [Alphaproteobacteria bacterium]
MSARTVVIGTGYWGKNLLRNLNTINALVGFYDSDAETRAHYSAEYPDAVAYDSIENVLADKTVEAAAIATPAVTHGALTKMALEADKHVFVEKPLCLDLNEARALGALAKQTSKTLMVGHLLLYHPAFIAVRKSVSNGDIGNLRYIYSNRASLGKIRRNENALWSFAPHDISMIMALTGRLPNRVTCNGEAWLSQNVADTTISHFDFGNQLQAHIFVSWLHPYKDHRLVVIGESGMLVFNDTLPGEDKVVQYLHDAGWDGDLPRLEKAQSIPVTYGKEEPLLQEMKHFVQCCETGMQPTSDASEGANVLAVLDMCQRALDSGMPVERADGS